MRRRMLAVSVVAVATLGLAGFTMIESSPSQQDDPAKPMSLHNHMEIIKRDMRSLFKAAASPDTKADALKAVSDMELHFVEAKNLEPESAEKVAEADREAYKLDYRRQMAEVLRELTDIELLIINDKNEEAVNQIKDKLVEMRNTAHDKFQVDD